MPEWIRGDVLDVRSAVQQWKIGQTPAPKPHVSAACRTARPAPNKGYHSLDIPRRKALTQHLGSIACTGFTGFRRSTTQWYRCQCQSPRVLSWNCGVRTDSVICCVQDTRNIARIVTELAQRGVRLLPNTVIYPGRRWSWMGKYGQVLEAGLP